ncbi:type II secretion system F family protein [Salinarimonas soli]|uniref:Type II secretion system F family protein n=1 Tax=Salinarimonas soli TaxID=1638099 RepID=A0A5B2V5Z0_9HYPH|nr:type II secretion system F family protein [Salinarimonas soli]KAA2234943.1 type II secretion system F family protein [Salinarimonas soli]
MPADIDPLYVFYAAAALAVVLAVEAVYLLFSSERSYRSGVNRRLALGRGENDREKVLVQLRRERGLSPDGTLALPGAALGRLVLQSGVRVEPVRLALYAVGLAGLSFALALTATGVAAYGLAAGAAGGLVLPVLILTMLRKRRQKRFGEQFPEAIDVIVRSLRAGHPVPLAIAMVAREMPDPIGSEFGIVADEITYGSDLEGAMRKLAERLGHEDLPLFITSIAIQASTGGNLSEILENLSKVIRERFKMRRKIRGLAAEGRASALILNLTPLLVFALVNWMSPDFYGSVWHDPVTLYVLGGAGVWMAIGNVIMSRMINFKF